MAIILAAPQEVTTLQGAKDISKAIINNLTTNIATHINDSIDTELLLEELEELRLLAIEDINRIVIVNKTEEI